MYYLTSAVVHRVCMKGGLECGPRRCRTLSVICLCPRAAALFGVGSSRDGCLHDRPSLRTGLACHASGSLDVISEANCASCGSKTGGIRLGRLCRYHSVVNETKCSVNQSTRSSKTPSGN